MSFFNHSRHNRFRHNKRSNQININNLFKFFRTHIRHWNSLDNSGIVHQNINSSHCFFYVRNHFFYLIFFCYVTEITFHFYSIFLVCL